MKLTISTARKLAVTAQGLSEPFTNALQAVEHLGYVQIDTISVVERAHHHVLWNRDPAYLPSELDRLFQKRKIFEYWSHAASYLPMKEYRFYRPLMNEIESGRRKWWFNPDHEEMKKVFRRIKKEGPLQAKDFEPPPGFKTGPWFTRKPAKRALDHLMMSGKLMISSRKGFQKVYDLTERVLPAGLNTTIPHPEELGDFFVRRTLRAHGLASLPEMTYLNRLARSVVGKSLRRLVSEGEVLPISVDQHSEQLYVLREGFERFMDLETAALSKKSGGLRELGKLAETQVHILSPFDNLVIQRKRVKWLFDFDYQIECYVPESKRKFGYFCLPLLWNYLGEHQLVGRIDAKADRTEKVLIINSSHLEKKLKKAEKSHFQSALTKSISEFSRFNKCLSVRFPEDP